MSFIALVILVIFCSAGFLGMFLSTPGTLIILIGAALYAWLTKFSVITGNTLIILITLYLAGETVEYFLVMLGAKKFGASNAAVAGAIVGALAGGIVGSLFFGIGLILGAFLGIFLGTFLVEFFVKRDVFKSLKAGAGGVLGRVGCILAKVVVALAMLGVIAAKVLR